MYSFAMTTIEHFIQDLEDQGLRKTLLAIADGVKGVASSLRSVSVAETGTTNLLGDKQLVADIEADACILEALRKCPAVALASSEEQPQDIDVSESTQGHTTVYSVAYDPLDGSSIIGADWAVGSIFGIWSGREFIGRSGRDMAAAVYAVFGPRTVLVMATSETTVSEFALVGDQWMLQRKNIKIEPTKKVFAPANLRCAADNEAYQALVLGWMNERYTLRYSGGLVPDVHHILTKGGGVFCNPASSAAPAKLRVLYECLPLAYIVEAAGGSTLGGGDNGLGSALDIVLQGHDDRSSICLGSKVEVDRCTNAMKRQK